MEVTEAFDICHTMLNFGWFLALALLTNERIDVGVNVEHSPNTLSNSIQSMSALLSGKQTWGTQAEAMTSCFSFTVFLGLDIAF